jgi:purine-binding chemotaxis protein CheW
MAQTDQYLTFGIERERFALPIERVREVLDLGPVSRLPNAPAYVLGLTDVRGAGMLVLDLRRKFGLPAAAATSSTRVIVVDAEIEGERLGFGLVADRVFAVSDLSGGELKPAPTIGSRWRAEYVVGVGREGAEFVVVLDLDRLIEMDALIDAATAA